MLTCRFISSGVAQWWSEEGVGTHSARPFGISFKKSKRCTASVRGCANALLTERSIISRQEDNGNVTSFRCSSVVEQCAVNALVAGSNPAAGAYDPTDKNRHQAVFVCGSKLQRESDLHHFRAGFEAVHPYFCAIPIAKKWETDTGHVMTEIPAAQEAQLPNRIRKLAMFHLRNHQLRAVSENSCRAASTARGQDSKTLPMSFVVALGE